MPVTELARLRLQRGIEASSPELLAGLVRAKEVLEQASKFEFSFYQCIEDPNVIFIFGSWPSVHFHMEEFIPSQPNQELLALLKDQVTVEWMYHLDIDQSSTPLPLDRDVVAVGRHVIRDGQKEGFLSAFEDYKRGLESFIDGPKSIVGGWRIDRGFDPQGDKTKEEYVLFSAWDSVERHTEFQKQEGFQKHQISEYADGMCINLAKLFRV